MQRGRVCIPMVYHAAYREQYLCCFCKKSPFIQIISPNHPKNEKKPSALGGGGGAGFKTPWSPFPSRKAMTKTTAAE